MLRFVAICFGLAIFFITSRAVCSEIPNECSQMPAECCLIPAEYCQIPEECCQIPAPKTEDQRPKILFNRWQEDWSVLANPNVPREPFDELKYIPLSCYDPKTYLSLGADWRNRYEYNNAMDFGIGPLGKKQSYVITRMEAHADLRIAEEIQVFVQLQNDHAPGKKILLPPDQNRLDLEQGFVAIVSPLAGGTLKFRAGRQQMAFDLQRFISVRDGPNVRQSYDAIWADYETKEWRYISYFSHPVQTRNLRCFDDFSSNALSYGGFRVEHKFSEVFKVASYISRFKQDNVANFPFVFGNERRNILDIRLIGKDTPLDWDLETMWQLGNISYKKIRAWAVGSVSGYTFEDLCLTPRIGLQFDAASGNRNRNSRILRTFNPLFPSGTYFTLASYTGFSNLIHVKPSVTLYPNTDFTLLFAAARQWRQSTADAVYVLPDIPIPGTVGLPGSYTGTYFQFRLDWQVNPNIHNMIELVQFNVSEQLRRIGGHNSFYAGVEVKFDW